MLFFAIFCILAINVQSEDQNEPLIQETFPHYQFDCNPNGLTYETSFSFLEGLATGFVHAEPGRIFFEYYFPAEHWVGFAAADQSIQGTTDRCSTCYFNNHYPAHSANHSNLYPKCIEECLDDAIFIATVNSDEENENNWNIIEFQIASQRSKKLNRKMYRIPKLKDILDVWGSQYYPYRTQAHFETDLWKVGQTEYIHAKFWRKYDFAPDSDIDEYDESNEWKPFVKSPEGKGLYYPDSLCFISIASFYGGEYPYDDDALNNLLPGFYIDTQHLADMHCYKLNDIKVDCGQDWSWLKLTEEEGEKLEAEKKAKAKSEIDTDDDGEKNSDTVSSDGSDSATDTDSSKDIGDSTEDIGESSDSDSDNDSDTNIIPDTEKTNGGDDKKPEPETTTTTTTSTKNPTAKETKSSKASTTKAPTIPPQHGEDCCSAISQISYDDINCLNISKSSKYIHELEARWKHEQCGRPDKLPKDLVEGIKNARANNSDCDHLWAYFNQIYAICIKYPFTKNGMRVYNHFKVLGGYECFGRNLDECKEEEASLDNIENFNNFPYEGEDESNDNGVTIDDLLKTGPTTTSHGEESELAEMEEDGGLTITTLGVLGLIMAALGIYVLYWFCCSNTSKGYRQSPHLYGEYYDDDIDTDEYTQKQQQRKQYMNNYNERINGGHYNEYNRNGKDDEDDNSDWSEDEQLGVIKEDHNQMDINNDYVEHKHYHSKKKKKKKKHKKSKKNKYKNDGGYDINKNDLNSMPINSDNDDDDEHDNNNNNGLDMNDAVEVTIDNNKNDGNIQNDDDDDDDDDDYYDEENETLQNEEEKDDK